MAATTAVPATHQAAPRAGTASPGRWMPLGLLVAAAVALFAPTLVWLYGRWTLSVWQHAHGLLLVPIVGYFIREELRKFRDRPRESSAWGFLILVPALALHAIDAGMHTQLLSAVALWLALPGFSLLLLGRTRTRAILFPLAFLAFALPIPLAFTEAIHWQLRQIVTAGTAAIVPLFGISLFVEGTTLHLAGGVLQVADACSGFSTLYAGVAVASLVAYSADSARARVLVLASAAPLAIAANVLRVIALVLLSVWYGTGILDTVVHPLSGVLTFALALPIIFWLGRPSGAPK